MKTILVASVLIASAALSACATDDGAQGDELDFEIQSADGKADAVSGKKVRFRTREQIAPWYDNGDARLDALADLSTVKSVTIDVATQDAIVVTGNVFRFAGTDGLSLDGKPWFGDQLFTISVEGAPGARTAAALGFIAVDADSKKISCARGATSINYFQELTVDISNREVHVNSDKTFTFAECGLSADGTVFENQKVWDLAIFVIPLETTGALKGKYNYKLNAEAI